MRKLILVAPVLLAASLAHAQQATTPPAEQAPARSAERQFAGEVVSIDSDAKTLTVKASQLDAKGERVEKTMTLPVQEDVATQLQALAAGDKVTVLWRKDDATQRDTVVKLVKREPAEAEKQ